MSDDNFVSFGTALEPIEEEEVARKKPITIADQIATDENGRRRFHGAFTGGFSAGYYNTVGSKEGWAPATFKSSRNERFSSNQAKGQGQNVTDFMDEEDMGAFGIAPQVLRQTDEFSMSEAQSSSRKRPMPKQSDGPIPGTPVLHQIIQPVKDTIGVRILIKMGWRPGQGVGPRVSRKKDKSKSKSKRKEEDDEIDKPTIVDDVDMEQVVNQRVYGCQLPAEFAKNIEQESSDEDIDADILYAPEDIESPLCNPKENTFGLGYKGLERMTETSAHMDLFGTQLKFRGENKKVSTSKKANLTGEAFGIGAFEEPDEDVYNREDLSSYDFELETAEERKLRKAKEAFDKANKKQYKDSCIEGFHFAKSVTVNKKFFPPPILPKNFEPFHKQRKSRFDKPAEKPNDSDASTKRGLGRHALTIQERQVLLGETPLSGSAEPQPNLAPRSDASSEPKKPDPEEVNQEERVERIKKFVQVLQAHSTEQAVSQPVFQPFMKNPEKQERYEKYITLLAAGFQDSLKDLQPSEMVEWEREREKQEFERARDIYKPLSGVMSSRFVTAKSHDISHIVPEKEAVMEKDPSEDPKVAAKLNLFGRLTHSIIEWHPDKVLCKRFNVKDPYPDSKIVGLLGISLAKVNISKINITAETEVISIPSTQAPKKSLFDNLDFSKPPPSWLPLSSTGISQPDLPPTGEESETAEIPEKAKSTSLEFQSSIKTEEKENVPVRAPLDLFKQIFADSSEESEAEEDNKPVPTPTKPTPTNLSNNEDKRSPNRNASRRADEERLPTKQTESHRSESKILYEKRYSKEEQSSGRDDTIQTKRKGIFDNLDLSRLSRKQNESGDNDQQMLKEADIKKEQEENGEDQDLIYGPKAPIKPVSNSAVNLTRPPQFTPTSSQLSSSFQRTQFLHVYNPNGSKIKTEDEEVVWVEKEVVSQSHSKSKKHSTKKSKKSKAKKTKSKEKHKKDKKRKSKKSKHKTSSGHLDSSSDEDSDDSSSSIEMHGSLNQKALLAQLKQISRSH